MIKALRRPRSLALILANGQSPHARLGYADRLHGPRGVSSSSQLSSGLIDAMSPCKKGGEMRHRIRWQT